MKQKYFAYLEKCQHIVTSYTIDLDKTLPVSLEVTAQGGTSLQFVSEGRDDPEQREKLRSVLPSDPDGPVEGVPDNDQVGSVI